MEYKFETEYFGLSENSFHLLRSRFNYKSYKYSEVVHIKLESGKLVNNWIAIFILGSVLIGFSTYYSYRLYYLLSNGQIPSIYIEEIVIPVIPVLLGLYCIYASLRSGPTIEIYFNDKKKKRFPLDNVAKNENLEKLQNSLKNLDGLKNKVITRI